MLAGDHNRVHVGMYGSGCCSLSLPDVVWGGGLQKETKKETKTLGKNSRKQESKKESNREKTTANRDQSEIVRVGVGVRVRSSSTQLRPRNIIAESRIPIIS